MTATAAPPRPGPPPSGAPAPSSAPTPTNPALPRHEPAAELGLALVTLTVIAAFSRVFSGHDYAGPLLVVAVATHGWLMVARRRGIGIAIAAVATAVGFILLTSWLFFADTTRVLVPTPHTFQVAQDALTTSWSSFQDVLAPTFPQPGFLMAAAFGVAFAVFLADWAAFRLWAPIEALVPMVTLFVFTALVGAPNAQIIVTTLFVAAALGFVLVHRVTQRERSTAWLPNQVDRGSSWLLRIGAVLVILAVVAGAVVGSHLPGVDDGGLVSWHGDRSGPSSRVTISPLVDIRSRLVDNADTQLFTVMSPQPAYWRMTALDTFDGQIWKSSGHYASVDGRLPDPLPSALDDPGAQGEVEQTFTISALSALWLPAAAEPVAINAPTAKVRFQKDTSTLIVDTNLSTSDNQTYTVDSVIPDLTADQLRSADTTIPSDIAGQDTALPANLSSMVHATAEQAIGAAATPYDKALALQTFFRETGGFVYDLTVGPGHGDNAIDDFLISRHGYCEQFAGTFAAMARSIGLPARVAVGFTPGIQSAGNPDRYEVLGEHAHAWPEVYLGQYGWVPFEPTPGRGAPNATGYTGVAPAQVGGDGTTPTTASPSSSGVPTTVPGGPGASNSIPADDQTGTGSAASSGPSTTSWVSRLVTVGLVLLALAAVYLVIVPGGLALRRRRRRARAHDATGRVRVAWIEAEEALAVAGEVRRPARASPEFARRAGARVAPGEAELVALAGSADAALFSAGPVDDDQAEAAEQTTVLVKAAVSRQVPWWRRAMGQLDARRLGATRRA